jgi:hypothetical protein
MLQPNGPGQIGGQRTVILLTEFPNSIGKAKTSVVYQLKSHAMRVTFIHLDHMNPVVELALGSEVRTFRLEEFTDFWLAMIEAGRDAITAHLEFLREFPRAKPERKG